MTKDRPCGSQEITSTKDLSARIVISFCGKISRFLVVVGVVCFCLESSSSLTTGSEACTGLMSDMAARGASTSSERAVAASTKCERPLVFWLCFAVSIFLNTVFLSQQSQKQNFTTFLMISDFALSKPRTKTYDSFFPSQLFQYRTDTENRVARAYEINVRSQRVWKRYALV